MQYEEMVASWSLGAPTVEEILLTHLAFSEPHSIPDLMLSDSILWIQNRENNLSYENKT